MSTATTTTQRSGGVGILGLLGVAFVVLKLTGVIAWSWLWVLAPFWGPVALLLIIGLISGLIALLVYIFKK